MRRSPFVSFTTSLAALFTMLLANGCGPRTPADRLLKEFSGSYPGAAHPDGTLKTFSLVAAPAEVPLVDGHRMKVWAYNGQVPGPIFRVRLGDTMRVEFENRLPQPTTVHWHGVRVPNGMDGVPHATQPPVEPGGHFTYEFTPKDAGTFWFHPHVRSSEQVERGLYGVLIVEDKNPPPYSRDIVWVLDDWLLGPDGQIIEEFNTPHDLMHDGRWGNAITVNGITSESLSVKAGERIRLRLLDVANGRIFRPDFGALEAKGIAVDGLYARAPFDPRAIELAPGNRLDLDITFPMQEAKFEIIDRFYPQRPNRLAEIRLEGMSDKPTPAFASPARGHVPAWKEGLSLPIKAELKLNSRRGGPFGIEWTINDRAFPVRDHNAGPMDHVPLDAGRFQRMRFANESYRLHPIHTHGMFFRVLARNGEPVDEPFFRDTVLVHSKEIVDVGMVPLDEGMWMLHCHILEHAEAGMMTMLDVRRRR